MGECLGLLEDLRARAERLQVAVMAEAASRGLGSEDGWSAIDWARRTAPGMTEQHAGQLLKVAQAADDHRLGELSDAGCDRCSARCEGSADLPVPHRRFGHRRRDCAGRHDARARRGASGVEGLTGRQLAIAINHAGRLLKPERDLVNEDRVRRAHRALYKSAGPAGMTTYRLVLDPEGAAILDAAIDPLASPHTRTCDDPMCGCRPGDADSAGRCRCNLAEAGTGCSCQRTSSEDRSDDGSRSGCDGGAAEGGRAGRSREADLRTPAARQADALLMVVARGVSSPGKAPKTAKSQVVVTMSFDSLREGIRGAGLTVGEELLSATTLPRLACDADIVPAVLGTRADVLEVGRKKRLLTSAIRVAAWLRDRHCTYRGCTIPCQWCDGHHGVAWYAGGDTGLLNTATLCARHHTIVHERDVRCTITDTRVTWHV